jgi:hypothetical protein
LPANIGLGWKGLPGTNTSAYYQNLQITAVISFIVQAPEVIQKPIIIPRQQLSGTTKACREIGQLFLNVNKNMMSLRGQASWTKMTSLRGKLTALACHPKKNCKQS